METITPIFYKPIFYGILTIIAAFVYPNYYFNDHNTLNTESKPERWIALFLALFFTLFYGNRPIDWHYFGDTQGYALGFNYISLFERIFIFDWDTSNLIYDNLFVFMAVNGFTYSQFFTLISAIYFFSIFYVCRRLFPNHLLLSFLTCMFSFVAYSSIVNGIKAGAASAIFLLALAYREKNLLLAIAFALISWGFHHAMHICLVAFVLAHFLRSPKITFLIWCTCVLIAFLQITYFQELLMQYTDEKGASYLMLQSMKDFGESYYTGFRWDFVLYSVMPILLGYYVITKYHIVDSGYNYLLNVYMLINGAWVLCMYANYANRIAALSWTIYPILLLYPFLRCNCGEDKYRKMTTVISMQMAFTLFMTFVVYSIVNPFG